MEAVQQMQGESVEEYVDEVWEETFLAQSQVVELQSVDIAPCAYGHAGQHQCAQCHHQENGDLVEPRQQAEVGAEKEHTKAHQREILGTEDTGEGACAKKQWLSQFVFFDYSEKC